MPIVSNGFIIVFLLSDNVVIVEMSQFAWRGFITVALRSTLTSFTDPMPLGLSLHTTLKTNPS